MAQQINISLAELYKMLCPKCQKKLKAMVKDKLTDSMVDKALEDKKSG